MTAVRNDDLSAKVSALMRHKDFGYDQLTEASIIGNEDGLETVALCLKASLRAAGMYVNYGMGLKSSIRLSFVQDVI